jgi:flagellar biosynthesis protein
MPERREPRRATPRRATALRYEHGDKAPRITATGTAYVAERIIAVALELGIPVKSDPALANALAAFDLGSEVPEEMYRAVAEALAWAYRLDATQPR